MTELQKLLDETTRESVQIVSVDGSPIGGSHMTLRHALRYLLTSAGPSMLNKQVIVDGSAASQRWKDRALRYIHAYEMIEEIINEPGSDTNTEDR